MTAIPACPFCGRQPEEPPGMSLHKHLWCAPCGVCLPASMWSHRALDPEGLERVARWLEKAGRYDIDALDTAEEIIRVYLGVEA